VPAGDGAWELCFTVSASAFEMEVKGSLGSGAGESKCNCGVAKIATSVSPVAVIKPRSRKVVLRILEIKLPPEKFGTRRAERGLMWKLECTSSFIDPRGRGHSD
jgi:hypothetical protein